MSSRDLNDLVPEMNKKSKLVIDDCKNYNVDILITCTLRTLEEQAKLYRQSRSTNEINNKIQKFREKNFGYLADILKNVGPSSGPHVTNAAPGESWHNYAEAWDAVPIIHGKAAWDTNLYNVEWEIYGSVCEKYKLNWAGNWVSFKEMPHVQLREGGNPLKFFNANEIKTILIKNNLL